MYFPAGMRLPMSARCESTPRPGTHDSSLFAPGSAVSSARPAAPAPRSVDALPSAITRRPLSICACDRLRSLRIFSECAGSAPHGGISRDITLVLMTFAHGRTSSYDVRVIGATSPARWQAAHLLKTMGATSLENVGTVAGAA